MNCYQLPIDFPFRYVSKPDEVVHLNNVSREILEMFYLCMATEESAALLTWPSHLENVAVFHSLAQLSQIVGLEDGSDTPGVSPFSTIFWPWKQNADIAQKRILVDRCRFVEGNIKCLNCSMEAGQKENFGFHMALNRVKDLNPEARIKHTFGGGHHSTLQRHEELTHPTLYEITPQATFQPGLVKHLPLANEGFLKRAQKYISDTLTDGPLLKIESAVFFMLGVPAPCGKKELLRGDLFSARRPDVVLLDLYHPYTRLGKNWQNQLEEVLSVIGKTFLGHERGTPPLLALTEDPIVFNRLTYKIIGDYEEKRRQKRHVSQYSFLNVVKDIFDEKETVTKSSNVPTFMVAAFADDMVDVFTAGQDLRNKMKDLGSEGLAEQIDTVSHVVRNVVNMPGGFDDYMQFIEEYCDQRSGRDVKEVTLKPLEEWTKLRERVNLGEAGADRHDAEVFLCNTRKIIDSLKKTTPLKERLDVLYEKLQNQQNTTNAIIFPSRQMCAFAEWMMTNRVNNESISTKVVFLEAKKAIDLSTSLLTEIQKIYFVLPRQKYLSRLIAQPKMPQDISFICDTGTVLALIRYVDILQKVPGLIEIKPRLIAMREVLELAAGNRISLLGELDEVNLVTNSFIYNLREEESGNHQGHPVIVVTEDGVKISAYEGTDILVYREDNDLQPFTKVQVSQLQSGDRFFVITSEFLDAASDKINITAMASETLRAYHARIVENVRGIRGWSLKDKAEIIQRCMKKDAHGADIGEGENVGNIVRWINVEKLLEMPRGLVKPHAPKIRKVFKLFMRALGVSDVEIDWYWAAAIQSTRKVRIRAGLDRNRMFYKLLLDPYSVKQFFRGDERDLLNLIDIACRNVFTVSDIIWEREDGNPGH